MVFGAIAGSLAIGYGAYKASKRYIDKHSKTKHRRRAKGGVVYRYGKNYGKPSEPNWITPVPRSAPSRNTRFKPAYSRQSYKYKFKRYS